MANSTTSLAALARAKNMAAMYVDAFTLAEIGEVYGITRERVRQILRKHTDVTREDGGAHRRMERRLEAADQERIAKWGCTLEQRQVLFGIGANMMRAGASYFQTPCGAFLAQRHNAAKRKIPWQLNLWEWWGIWQASGKWEERGRGDGYVMSRRRDAGPYSADNVFIQTARENSSEARLVINAPVGVSELDGRFVAKVKVDGKGRFIGVFDDAEAAHDAYRSALANDNFLTEAA